MCKIHIQFINRPRPIHATNESSVEANDNLTESQPVAEAICTTSHMPPQTHPSPNDDLHSPVTQTIPSSTEGSDIEVGDGPTHMDGPHQSPVHVVGNDVTSGIELVDTPTHMHIPPQSPVHVVGNDVTQIPVAQIRAPSRRVNRITNASHSPPSDSEWLPGTAAVASMVSPRILRPRNMRRAAKSESPSPGHSLGSSEDSDDGMGYTQRLEVFGDGNENKRKMTKDEYRAVPSEPFSMTDAQGEKVIGRDECCGICLEIINIGVFVKAIPCAHRFCPKCFWASCVTYGRAECPSCRMPFVQWD